MLQPMEDMILPPKRQAVVDRLRRRIDAYRRRQTECVPRFDQSFTGACEQQNLETSALQKRFLEGKAKRQAKKSDRKPDLPAISGNLHSSVHVQQKFGCGDYEPPAKLQCGGIGGAGEALTKFSVEIVQQLEFTTSAADSQPQQISTNVTVKALANAVKTSNSPPPQAPPRVPTPLDCDRECKAECKSEVAEDEFVGLDECAAALERDAASAFPGLAELIGEDDGDDTFEDLITEIAEYPEFMKDFDLDGSRFNGLGGMEPPEGEPAPRYGSTSGEMSPAAQTLKHMAEQHQQAAGGDWRYRGYSAGGGPTAGPGAGSYRPRPSLDHLHMSQHQQLHLSQPHHNLQVSAAQHMQVSGASGGHVSVAAQQGMYANFHQQPTSQHHQGGGNDSYSMSQSQSINFSQAMRPRPAHPSHPAHPAPSAAQPQQPQAPLGVAAAGISREQQAKMLQQQQQHMLRAQQQQAQQQQMRPPPPEYKARFVGPGVGAGPAAAAAAAAARRAAPPRAYPPLHPRQYSPEWRHVMLQQQARQQLHHHQGQYHSAGMYSIHRRFRYGRHGRRRRGRHGATADTAAAFAYATAATAATATAAEGVESAAIHVTSHHAAESDDERTRTDVKHSHEPKSEHVDAGRRHGRHELAWRARRARRAWLARRARRARRARHARHARRSRARRRHAGGRAAAVPGAARLRLLLGRHGRLQPGLPRQHADKRRRQPHGAGAAQLARQLPLQRHPVSGPEGGPSRRPS